jgi:hypothetical protein
VTVRKKRPRAVRLYRRGFHPAAAARSGPPAPRRDFPPQADRGAREQVI